MRRRRGFNSPICSHETWERSESRESKLMKHIRSRLCQSRTSENCAFAATTAESNDLKERTGVWQGAAV